MMKGTADTVYEAPRLDFENDQELPFEAEEQLIDALKEAAKELDVLCVCDQMKNGCVTRWVREAVTELADEGLTVIVDSRDQIGEYKNVIVKPNDIEASRALGYDHLSPGEAVRRLHEKTGKTALVTAGPDGCWLCSGEYAINYPAFPVDGPIDICGAGDTFLAGFGSLLAGGATPIQAAQVATLCSAVTIKKIGTTGTATREEVLAAWDMYIK